MYKEIDGAFENKNSELLENVFIPATEKANIKDSKAFQILKDNKQDVSELFTGKKNEMFTPITIKKYEEKEKETNAQYYLNSIKDIGNNLFDFVDQSVVGDTVDYAASGFDKEKIPPTFGILANNIGEFGVNMLPVMDKLVDFMAQVPGEDGKSADVFNNDQKLMEWSGDKVKYFKENRAKFKAIQEDANLASQFANLVVQDTLVSLPLYEGLVKAGVPKAWATVLGFGMGSAIALEDKLFGAESTFIQEFGKEEVNGLKKILNILPDTPIDAIADEVIQTFEYTAFAFAIPPIIQAAKFMKTNLPSFAIGGAVAGAIEGADPNTEEPTQEFNLGTDQGKKKSKINLDDQSAIPGTVNEYGFEKTASLKGLVNLVKGNKQPVFNSAVKQAVDNIAEKGSGEQILGSIKNVPGVKANEIKWIGLDDFLKGKKSVTKKEVVDFVNQNNIDVTEVSQGGKSSKLSDDLEEKILNFEQKIEKAARAQDLGYADINYDVYPYSRSFANNKEVSNTVKDMSMDFSQLADMLEGLPIKSKSFLDDFTTKSGQIEVHKFTDNLNNRPVYVGRELAETLINEKEIVRDIPAALNSPGTPRYTRNRVLEFDPLEIEKFLIERERRIFMSNNNSPKFERFTEPGGEDYTELVFKIKKGGMDVGIPVEAKQTIKNSLGEEVISEPSMATVPYKNPSHMNIKSEIAHVRFKTRYGEGLDDGKKILTVEEMQSDFAIAALKAAKTNQSGKRITDFPFKNTWYELTTKRLIRYAADNDFDAIAIPKGIVSAKRYGQKIEPVNRIEIQDLSDGIRIKVMDTEKTLAKDQKFKLKTFDKKDDYLDLKEVKKFKEIVNVINKQFKINFDADNYIKKLSSEMKKGEVGAEHLDDVVFKFDKPIMSGSGLGKFELYDRAIPSFLKKYSKKWNAKVYDDTIGFQREFTATSDLEKLNEIPVTILEITPSMKKSVQEQGQSLFEILGIGAGAGIAAESISDSKGNNTISNLTQ